VTTFLGNGLPAVTAGTGTAASINLPLGLAIGVMSGVETLFAASAQHVVVAAPIATGVMTILAGAHGLPGSTDSTTGTSARFNSPNALALDTTNSYIFVADINNNAIRRIAYTGTYAVTTLGTSGFVASATPVTITGTAVRGLVFDGTSTLYYCSSTAYGKVTTAGVNTSNASGFTYASGITFNSNKTGVYFVDWGVHQLFSAGLTGAATAIAGTSGVAGSLDATGLNATLNGPRSLTLDPTGSNLYIAEYGNNKIRKFNIATSNVTTYAGTGVAGFADGSVPTATTVNNTLLVSSNIGINNNTPTYPLDVQGALRCYSPANDVMGLMAPTYGNYIHIGAWNQAGATSKNLVLNQFGGNVGIGTNAPAYTLDVAGQARVVTTTSVPTLTVSGAGGTNGISGNNSSIRFSNTGGGYWQIHGPDTGSAFHIVQSGGNGCTIASSASAWSAESDSRLKTIIEPISNATSAFETMTPVFYTLNADTSNIRRIGLLAQEVLPHYPETVSENTDGFYGLRYTELVSPLITAIKELSARLSNVEARLAAATTS
jgi:DNA-binding beta-propeller fold protein YncE